MFLLLDENITVGLFRAIQSLQNHHVEHALHNGMAGIPNGQLIKTAEQRGFDVLVTADQRLSYQQNLTTRRLGLVVISSPQWPAQRPHLLQILQIVEQSSQRCFLRVELPVMPLKRRPPPLRP